MPVLNAFDYSLVILVVTFLFFFFFSLFPGAIGFFLCFAFQLCVGQSLDMPLTSKSLTICLAVISGKVKIIAGERSQSVLME